MAITSISEHGHQSLDNNFRCRQKEGMHDLHVVCTLQAGVVVGHVPQEIVITASYILQHNRRITCEVTGPRKLLSVLNKGLYSYPFCLHLFGKTKDDKETYKNYMQQEQYIIELLYYIIMFHLFTLIIVIFI